MNYSEIKLRKSQRDNLLFRIMSESPVEQNTVLSYLLLKEKLAKGQLYEDDDLLHNYVELNSLVTVKTSFGYKYGLKIVMPEESNIQMNKLSVLSALGCALLGHKEGDKVKWYFQGEAEFAEIIRVIPLECDVTSLLRTT